MIKNKNMKSRRYEHIIFEEPLINISMEPTLDVDPLFIDPTAESHNDDVEDFTINGSSIFSPKVGDFKQKKSITSEATEEETVKIKKEVESEMEVKIKEEPKDMDESDFELQMQEEEVDPVEALAQALDKVEYLCPKCTFRSTDKQEVNHHLISSHRVFQVGIPRPCDKCDYIAKTVRELTAHKKAKHPRTFVQDNLPNLPTGEFKCPHCDFTSFHRNNVRSHVKIHTQDTVYTCDKCPYTAISRLNIENHAARHLMKSSRKWKFKCKHCGLMERTEKLLQRHLILHGEGEMLKCEMCPYKSPYSHIITMHTRICHGITGKRSLEREEKWKNLRKSTRKCTRDKKNYNEEKIDEFLELPPKRHRKKKLSTDVSDLTESKADDGTTLESTENEMDEQEEEKPRRPTLEERLGRARELINKNLSSPKKKDTNTTSDKEEEEDEDKEEWERSAQTRRKSKENDGSDNPTSVSGADDDDNSDNDSDVDDASKSADDWSHEESDFDPAATAHESESLHSSVSDRATLDSTTNNSTFKDNENSLTDSESRAKIDNSETESDRFVAIKNSDNPGNNSKRCLQSLEEIENCQQEDTKRSKIESSPSRVVTDNETASLQHSPGHADTDDDDSLPAVLVLKRKGTSFTSFLKNNSDSS